MKVVYLVPAPDMSEKAVRTIQIDGYEVIPLNLEPLDTTTHLDSYIQKLASQVRHPKPILLGFCYGGVLALELAKVVDTEKVIVVSSIKSHHEIARSRKLLAKLYCRMPNSGIALIGMGFSLVVNKLLRLNIHVPRVWKKTSQNKFLVRHALRFNGVEGNKKVVHIHGGRDLLLPVRGMSNAQVIPGGGHFMYAGKRKELLNAIADACLS